MHFAEYDNCFNEGESGTPQISFRRCVHLTVAHSIFGSLIPVGVDSYNAMSTALNATGRPILYRCDSESGNPNEHLWLILFPAACATGVMISPGTGHRSATLFSSTTDNHANIDTLRQLRTPGVYLEISLTYATSPLLVQSTFLYFR